MKLKGIFVEIRVNSEPVKEYPYPGRRIKNQVQCWIPSSRGHNFDIVCGISNTKSIPKLSLGCEISLDDRFGLGKQIRFYLIPFLFH
ncbi:hypothetical protein BDV93DRAFT_297893 [Ceratobasidium sp. AG-I]|nr:hypothetical protein BDV93DRAFT_297893 [Ceratobasidium sp. AG-I]